jgi:hypothetical protein
MSLESRKSRRQEKILVSMRNQFITHKFIALLLAVQGQIGLLSFLWITSTLEKK